MDGLDEDSVETSKAEVFRAEYVEQVPELHLAYTVVRPKIRDPINFEVLSRLCTSAGPYDQDEIAAVSNAVRYELTSEGMLPALDTLQSLLYPSVAPNKTDLLPYEADRLADQYGWTMLFRWDAVSKADTGNFTRIIERTGAVRRQILWERENKLGKYAPAWEKTKNVVTFEARNPATDLSVSSLSGSAIPEPTLFVRAHQRKATPIIAAPSPTNVKTNTIKRRLFDEESEHEDTEDLKDLDKELKTEKDNEANATKKGVLPNKKKNETLKEVADFERKRRNNEVATPKKQKPDSYIQALSATYNATIGKISSVAAGAFTALLAGWDDDKRVPFSVQFTRGEKIICTVEVIPAPRALQSIGDSVVGYLIESIDSKTGVMKRLGVRPDQIPAIEKDLTHNVILSAFKNPETKRPGLPVDLKAPFFAKLKETRLQQDIWTLNVWCMKKYGNVEHRRSWIAVVVEDVANSALSDLDLIYYRLMAARHIEVFVGAKEPPGRVYFFPHAIRLEDPIAVTPTYKVQEQFIPSTKNVYWSTNASITSNFFWRYMREGSTVSSYRKKKKPDSIYLTLTQDDGPEIVTVSYSNGIPISAGGVGVYDEGNSIEKSIVDAVDSFFRTGAKAPATEAPRKRK